MQNHPVACHDASLVPDLEAWEAWRPEELAATLEPAPVPWAVAGGWAIDLHLGRETRRHDDLEIVVARSTAEQLLARLPDLEFFAVHPGHAWLERLA